jgi:hypothetical protein
MTHTSLTGSKWNIPSDKQNKFYKLYSKEQNLSIAEKCPELYKCIVIDLDLLFKENTRITNNEIEKIVNLLTTILKEIYEDSDELTQNYTCIVLQRPNPYNKISRQHEYWKNGVHIHFPYIIAPYTVHYALRQRFIETYKFEIECENKIDEIYDNNVRVTWLLYGSSKPEIAPYEITQIYNNDNLKINDYDYLEWIKLLSIRNNIEPIKIKNEKHINNYLENYLEKLQPPILKDPEIVEKK